MLVPGFSVRELPVHLPNINNLRFGPDGQLYALGYNGKVYRLEDKDRDGLEDSATVYWDQPTLTVPVGMVWAPEGLYISSHGKVSLLVDTNRDGKADFEKVVASGWPPTDVAAGGVDATGVTRDSQGNLYFGLITADYSNPYRVKDGTSHYSLDGPRGTVQKLPAHSKKLETFCTGIRVPYQLAFNQAGDLFLTDQEGETWCPNGNPLDEFNQIIRGRNYGFPPRDEKYLPSLVSEPPVVAFAPQHQSACGFFFNEAANRRQKIFGPAWWKGAALVAGESRGKIWRVDLFKTAAGYLGRETTLARLAMLTTDLARGPGGDLYASCHSGGPDWGTGPNGEGKIFKISYTRPSEPQPVAAWADSPMSVQVLYDRPLGALLPNLAKNARLEFGEFAGAGDEYEVLKPPYKTVAWQGTFPRGKLAVVETRLKFENTIELITDPHPQSVRYALTLPHPTDPSAPPSQLAYGLHGVSVAGAAHTWQPHFLTAASRYFLGPSATVRLKGERGTEPLRLQSELSLPAGEITVQVRANSPFVLRAAGQNISSTRVSASQAAQIHFHSQDGERVPCAVEFPKPGERFPEIVDFFYSSREDPALRPVRLDQLFVPWAPPLARAHPSQPPAATPELNGGDLERGRGLFFSAQLRCGECHAIRGEGKAIGPDLSNLSHKEPAAVLGDIQDPNAAINPDYVGYELVLKDGEVETGFLRAQSAAALRLVAIDGKERIIPRADLKAMHPARLSLMPSGLLDKLASAEVRDLLTFLTSTNPAPAGNRETQPGPAAKPSAEAPPAQPPPRRRAEMEAVLSRTSAGKGAVRPLRAVLVAGPKDHGPGEHDYPAWQTEWAGLLRTATNLTLSTAWEWPAASQFAESDLLVFYFWNHQWTPERYRELDAYLARGGGAVFLHAAVIADREPERLAESIGLAAQPVTTRYRHGALELSFERTHPINARFGPVKLVDETYWPMIGPTNQVQVVATAREEERSWPMLWTFEKGKGRVVGCVLGHYSWTFADPLFRVLILRGMAWAAGEPIDRFERLALSGLTLSE